MDTVQWGRCSSPPPCSWSQVRLTSACMYRHDPPPVAPWPTRSIQHPEIKVMTVLSDSDSCCITPHLHTRSHCLWLDPSPSPPSGWGCATPRGSSLCELRGWHQVVLSTQPLWWTMMKVLCPSYPISLHWSHPKQPTLMLIIVSRLQSMTIIKSTNYVTIVVTQDTFTEHVLTQNPQHPFTSWVSTKNLTPQWKRAAPRSTLITISSRQEKSKQSSRLSTVRARPCNNKRRLNQREWALKHGQCIAVSRGNPSDNELKN